VTADSKNNIIVVGKSMNSSGNWDCILIKYDPSGNILWKKIYDTGKIDYGYGVCVDTRDNIIVAGHSYKEKKADGLTVKSDVDGFIVKYNTKGESIFTETYDSGNDDYLFCAATDSKDSIIVAGHLYNGINSDYLIIKYDYLGKLQWIKTYDGGGTDVCYGIAVDNKDNIFVTGKSYVVTDDYLTIKYDSRGNLLWTRLYDNGKFSNDSANGIAVDSDGNVIVVGYVFSSGIGTTGFVSIKYDSDGALQWLKPPTSDLPNGDYIVSVNSAKISQDGNIIMSGISHNGTNYDCLVMKYNPKGEMTWFKIYNSSWDDFGSGACTDKNNNVIVTGRTYSNSINCDILTIKYKEE
jgi:uncharacterized delta-60 repeat protein